MDGCRTAVLRILLTSPDLIAGIDKSSAAADPALTPWRLCTPTCGFRVEQTDQACARPRLHSEVVTPHPQRLPTIQWETRGQ